MVNVRTSMLGKIAVAGGYLSEEDLESCLHEQHSMEQAGAAARLGEIMIHKGFIDEAVLQELLNAQKSLSSGLFGEIAVRLKSATVEQVEECLRFQEDGRKNGENPGLIGQVMISRGAMNQQQVQEVLDAQNDNTLICDKCGMKYNAWKMSPGQRINCAMCGNLLVFRPKADPEVEAVVNAALAESEVEFEAEETSLFPEIPGYTILSQLGTSEDSTLYEALQDKKERKVVIELMNGIPSSDTVFMERLQSEAKMAVSLHHPAVKHIYSLGKYKGHPYIVTEYVESESLFNVLQREKRLPALGATQIVISIAEALEAADNVGLTHGDIKPSLILFLKDGTVKISNLGIAKKFRRDLLTMDERSRFISSYMAPELIIGKSDPTVQSDIFSLGAVYYNLLCGAVPFEGTTPKEIILSISSGLKDDLRSFTEIPHDVMDLVEMMLATDPRRRIQSYEILLMRLNNIKSKLAGVPPIHPERKKTKSTTSVTGSLRSPRRSTTRSITDRHRRPGTGTHRVGTGKHRIGTGDHMIPGERTQAIMETMELLEKKDKTSAGVILLRVFFLLVIVAAGYFGYNAFKGGMDDYEKKRMNKMKQMKAEAEAEKAAQKEPEKPVTPAPEVKPVKPAVKKADPELLKGLMAEVQADVNNIPRVLRKLDELKKEFPDDTDLVKAAGDVEQRRKQVAQNIYPLTESAVHDYIQRGEYSKAKQKADQFCDMFYGLEQARKIDQLRLKIPEIEAEKYFKAKEQIESFTADKKYKEAIAMLDGIILNFSSDKWITEARTLKGDLEAKLAHKEDTAGMRRGRNRMKHYAAAHKSILDLLGGFNVEEAEKQIEVFETHEDGKNLPRLVTGMKEELALIKSLRTRVSVNINKGFISKYLKTPGSAEALPIQNAGPEGVKVGPVFLAWTAVPLATRSELVKESSNYSNAQQVAELAVFYSAVGEKDLALKWLQNSTQKGFDTSNITPLFHTTLDIEAERTLKEAEAAFEQKLWIAAKKGFIKLISDYPDTIPVMRTGYEELEKRITAIDGLMREGEQEPAEEPAEKKEEAPVANTGLRQELQLEFNDETDLRYIFPETGLWKVRNLALCGMMKRGENTLSTRFKCEKPVFFSAKVMFDELNAGIHVKVGEVELMVDITSGLVYTTDSEKTRKQNSLKLSAKQWYDFSIAIDRQKKTVVFQFANIKEEMKCTIFGDDIQLFVDQKNTVYFDSILIKADFISKNELIP